VSEPWVRDLPKTGTRPVASEFLEMRAQRPLKTDHRIDHLILRRRPVLLVPPSSHWNGRYDPASSLAFKCSSFERPYAKSTVMLLAVP
jgi:hypothetical protein